MGKRHAQQGTSRARHAASDEIHRPSRRLSVDSTKQTPLIKHSRGKPCWTPGVVCARWSGSPTCCARLNVGALCYEFDVWAAACPAIWAEVQSVLQVMCDRGRKRYCLFLATV